MRVSLFCCCRRAARHPRPATHLATVPLPERLLGDRILVWTNMGKFVRAGFARPGSDPPRLMETEPYSTLQMKIRRKHRILAEFSWSFRIMLVNTFLPGTVFGLISAYPCCSLPSAHRAPASHIFIHSKKIVSNLIACRQIERIGFWYWRRFFCVTSFLNFKVSFFWSLSA